MGMKCIKVVSLPSKADRDEQEDYKEKKLEPRLHNKIETLSLSQLEELAKELR